MTFNRMAVPALVLVLGATGFCTARASGLSTGSPLSTSAQDRGGWDTPPRELQEVQRQGFHDGIEGARNDFDNHRRLDLNNRDEYRNPRRPGEQREAYRDGYRRGYEQGASHFQGGPQQPMGQTNQQMGDHDQQMRDHDQQMGDHDQQMRDHDQQMQDPFRGGPDPWRGQGSDIQRRGFQDGMEGARRDRDDHRRANAGNRDEYRHPSVPRQMRDEYRDAYRRGYDRAMALPMDGRPDRR